MSPSKNTLPTLKFFHNSQAKVLDVILHGGSVGMDAPFMKKVIATCRSQGHSVVAFNFPFFDRGDDHSSGPELVEELNTLRSVLAFCSSEKFSHIRIIGKSLGAIVGSYYLKNLDRKLHKRFSIVVLGYVIGSIDLTSFEGRVVIIQGENDKFGNITQVKKSLTRAAKNINYFEIKGGDHSYRNPETKEPDYEDEVVKILTTLDPRVT